MASSAAFITRRMPGPSTPTGFSVKMFLPAFTAASSIIGRKPGGVARITRSAPQSMTFWKASNPTKQRSSATSQWGLIFSLPERFALAFLRLSSNTSPRAKMVTPLSSPTASQRFSTAPEPRPPQPIRPTLIESTPEAWALAIGARAKPAAAAEVALRKSRRCGVLGSVMGRAPGLGEER